jgi:hypothetical protein
MLMEIARSLRLVLNHRNIHQSHHEPLYPHLYNNHPLPRKTTLPNSKQPVCLIQLLHLDCHPHKLSLAHRTPSRVHKGMDNLANMVASAKQEPKNPHCRPSHLMPLANKRHQVKVLLKAILINKLNLSLSHSHSHSLEHSLPHPQITPHIIPQAINAMRTIAITKDRDSTVPKVRRMVLHHKDHIVAMWDLKPKELLPRSPIALLNNLNHDSLLLAKVQQAATVPRTQLRKTSPKQLLKVVPNLVIHNSLRLLTTQMATLITQAHTMLSI